MHEKTILLVEDNSDDEVLTLRALNKHHLANKIDVVRDGAEALDYLFCRGDYVEKNTDDRPQLILLDINLPKIDGLEVLKIIREDERTRHIPVVMLTTSTGENDIVSSYDYGANSYIKKPVDFKEFVDAVSQVGIYWLAINCTPKD
jgi:two-component system response regulator